MSQCDATFDLKINDGDEGFMSLSTVFQLFRSDGRVNMKGSVQ